MAGELDKELVEYLREDRREREKLAARVEESIRIAQNTSNAMLVFDQKLDKFTGVLDEKMKGIVARIDALERGAEDTGKHTITARDQMYATEIAELREKLAGAQAALEKREARGFELMKTGLVFVLGLVSAAIVGAVGFVIGRK